MPNERQRREAERRRLKRQLQRRAEREARRRRFAMIASIIGTLAVIGVVIGVVVATSDDKSTPPAGHGPSATAATTPATTTSSTPAPAAYPCTWTPSGTAAKQVTPPKTKTPPKTGKVNILVNSTRGNMTFQLDRSLAPCAVESFASLAEQNYFNGSPCHRLVTANIFVLQCGDPTGTGSGGPGYSFADELSGKEKYTRGVIAMANSGPNTNGSQFFIVYKKTPLPPSYTIFGKVTTGLNVVDKVAAAGSDNSNGQGDGKPNKAITLTSVGVVE